MMPSSDIETALRAQHWREPPPAFLLRVLDLALEESRQHPEPAALQGRPAAGCPKNGQSASVVQAPGTLQMAADLQKHRPSSANQEAAGAKRRPWPAAVLAFIPRPLRLPLAACWLLALFFHLTTPAAVPQATLDALAKLPAPPTPAQLLAHLEEAERLAHECLEQLRGPVPPL